MDIIISSNSSMPIYEQITSQVKAQVMDGRLQQGQSIPSMRALAKSLHISVITVQRAYEDLQRDGFIETVVGKGSFISGSSKDFWQEEQQRLMEEHLSKAVEIGRRCGIRVDKMKELVDLFYEED